MQPRPSFHLLFTVLLVTLTGPLPLLGDENPNRAGGGQPGRRATSEDEVARRLAALQQAIDRLETKIDRLSGQPSEFSRVEVRIVDEQGQPMGGFEVQLTSSDQAQRAQASGVSDNEGLALARHLPYGRYRMNVSGNGWRTSDLVTLEVGAPLEQTVVAPTPDRLGELVLQASLSRDVLDGLRFGEWEIQHDNNWGTRIAPEPEGAPDDAVVEVQEDSSNGWKTFPTVSDGIEAVAVMVEINLQRRTEQPDGDQQTWH